METTHPSLPPHSSTIAELADTFHLLGDASRLSIVFACMGGPIAVGDIAETLGLGDSLVSHHLRLLKASRLVKSEREGKRVLYSISDHHVATVLANMTEHMAEHAHKEQA
jgi:DNA-binding transcriptional ArsR family regulator